MATPFSVSELQDTGKTYGTYGLFVGGEYDEVLCLNAPITPKENFRRFMSHRKDFEWVPDPMSDYFTITPETNPDNHAMGMEGGLDSFGVEWEALENGLPALVRPGNPKLKDIADWRELEFPDPETWGLREEGKKYLEHADHDRPFRGMINIGLFERLIDLMGFEEAAAALVTDPEEVAGLLEKITDFNLKLIDIFIEDYHVDAILLGDDWSSQLAPFYSEKVTRSLFLPCLKRMSDRAHQAGIPFMLHSCGNGVEHIPVWIDAGVDGWQFQENAVDLDRALLLAGDKLILEGYWVLPEGLDEEGQAAYAKNIMDQYCKNGQLTVSFCDAFYQVTPFLRKKVYELGRLAAQ